VLFCSLLAAVWCNLIFSMPIFVSFRFVSFRCLLLCQTTEQTTVAKVTHHPCHDDQQEPQQQQHGKPSKATKTAIAAIVSFYFTILFLVLYDVLGRNQQRLCSRAGCLACDSVATQAAARTTATRSAAAATTTTTTLHTISLL